MTVTKEIEKLERAFDRINEHYYQNQLPKVVIHYYPDRSKKAYGWITINKTWTDGKESTHEINISANFADRSKYEVYATLMHEMVHLYCMENGIQDCSNNGYYHNQNFKMVGEAHGLKLEKMGAYGWTTTTLNEEAKQFISSFDEIETIYKVPVKKIEITGTIGGSDENGTEEKPKRKSSYKHVCPVCGAIARTSKADVHLVCGDCMEKMVIVD